MAKSKSSFFIILIVCTALLSFLSIPSLAAVVEGDQVVRYVDTPTGTILYEGTAIDASPKSDISSQSEYTPDSFSQETVTTKRSETVQNEIPEVPNFEAEVEDPVQKHKNNNTLFLVIGAIVIIIGVGVILFIAKSREKE